jgi:signal transduction histidine kinase
MEAPSPVSEQLRVLVVDDNEWFRGSLVHLLRTADIEVVAQAGSGREALAALEARPNVVLMDMRMPGMSGIETTRALKVRDPDLHVLALTAQDDQDVVREMLAAGAAGYILKESDGDAIIDAILKVAGGAGVISPAVTPTVIEELTSALERERHRSAELQAALDNLAARVQRRGELVARLGHELRTPVTVIYGMAKTLIAEGVDLDEEARRDLLERLAAKAESLADLSARFESEVEAGPSLPVDLSAIVQEVSGGDPRVIVVGGRVLPPVTVDPLLARTVVSELMANALGFSEDGAAVGVSLALDDGSAILRVTDRGPGIAEESRQRIFEPLEQEEPLDTRQHQGAGLGLARARAAARAMGGDVVLESTGPAGSVFTWSTPLR